MNSSRENGGPPENTQRRGADRLGASLLFPGGSRPTAAMVARLFESSEMDGIAARISHRADDAQGWVEILASGLTFDLRGLAPADPAAGCEPDHAYGFADGVPDGRLEAIEIVPGPHIAASSRLLPVVRVLAGLTANLALNLRVAAVEWHGARTCIEPRFFSRTVLNWLADGPFPALGLTALMPASDGSIASRGLAALIGQELQLAAASGETPADTLKLAVLSLIHI